MSNGVLLQDNRQLIPRWHTSNRSFQLQFPAAVNLSSNIVGQSSPSSDNLDRLSSSVQEWQQHQSVTTATDLLIRLEEVHGTDRSEYADVRKFLCAQEGLRSEVRVRLGARDQELGIKGYETKQEGLTKRVHALRHRVRQFPRDALSWMDLAFYYMALELRDQAEDCLKVSVTLAPHHPFVARSFSRYLIHIDQYEEAYAVLKRTGLIKTNPLVASAAISISNAFDVGGVHIKSARGLLDKFDSSPHLISDLAASLGTQEIKSGAVRRGKKLITSSLVCPSENALAQYNWLRHKLHITLPRSVAKSARSAEADATELYVGKEFKKCRDKLMEVHAFQPFSDKPLISAGYISMIGSNDPQFVIDVSEGRLPLSNMSFEELNNLVIAKMETKALDAEMYYQWLMRKKPAQGTPNYPVYLAAMGYHSFYANNPLEGSKHYNAALECLYKKNEYRSVAVATHFYAKNLQSFYPEGAKQLFDQAEKLAKKFNILELQESNHQADNDSDEQTSQVTWSHDALKNGVFYIPNDILK